LVTEECIVPQGQAASYHAFEPCNDSQVKTSKRKYDNLRIKDSLIYS